MKKNMTQALLLVMIAFISGCASLHTPRSPTPETITTAPAQDYQYTEIIGEDIDSIKGIKVRWGGEVIKVKRLDDGKKRITLIEQPIKENGKPDYTDYQIDRKRGRFIVELDANIDAPRVVRNKFVVVYGEINRFEQTENKTNRKAIPIIQAIDLHAWRSHYRGNNYASCYNHFGYEHFHHVYYPHRFRHYFRPYFFY